MSVFSELAGMTGVIAAGEYSYRGDRYNFKGQLSDDMARGNTDQFSMFTQLPGWAPPRGWNVRGSQYTVCSVGNLVCFIDNAEAARY